MESIFNELIRSRHICNNLLPFKVGVLLIDFSQIDDLLELRNIVFHNKSLFVSDIIRMVDPPLNPGCTVDTTVNSPGL